MLRRMLPGTAITEQDVRPDHRDGLETRTLIPGGNYAEPLVMRGLRWSPGATVAHGDDRHDEYLYVMDGAGSVSVAGGPAIDVSEGCAVQVPAGQAWRIVAGDDGLHAMSFLVPAPTTPWAAQLAKDVPEVVNVAHLGAQAAQAATGDRQFEVLFDARRGSRGATMFVGFIPTSGAPEHYHLYDELCCIVRGSGVLAANGERQPIQRGSSFHVAPRLLHAIENPNPEDLWILGVFRPEGSAAAAFYPDGTPAPNNED